MNKKIIQYRKQLKLINLYDKKIEIQSIAQNIII